jgi:signal transduction protein with GAF and PtsI domain
MIESMAAFALAGNILQFVEAGYKATVILRQIWDASATDENLEIDAIAQDVTYLASKITKTSYSSITQSRDEKRLQQLARNCETVAGELDKMLQDLVVRSKGAKRRIEAVKNTLKLMYHREKIVKLLDRLKDLRDQLSARMLFALR